MKASLLILLITLLGLSSAGTLVVTNPIYEARYGRGVFWTPNYIDPVTCGYEVDYFVRTKFAYYLSYFGGVAELSFMSHNVHQDGFLFLHQYRNTFGTFMSICKYEVVTTTVRVISFSRLGEGYPTYGYVSAPFRLRPFNIFSDMGEGVYQVPLWGKEETPVWTEDWARSRFYKTPSAADAASARCANLDTKARKDYWYYLDGAKVISSSNSAFGNYCYCQIYYVNRIGSWQVIGTHGPSGVEISTFVRLGDGYDPATDGLCKPYPSFDSWRI